MKRTDTFLYLAFGIIVWVFFMNKKDIGNYIDEKITGINNAFDDVFKKAASMTGVSAKMIKAISANESSVGQDKRVEKIGNTQGVMHLIYDTAKRFSPGLNPGDHKNLPVDKDIEIGAKYLSFLLKRYGNIQHAVMAYNGGEGRMDQIVRYEKTGVFTPLKRGPNQTPDSLQAMLGAKKNMIAYWERYQRNFNKLGLA